MRLRDKRVFISAAANGIGRASALACAAEGATVVATDIDPDGLASLASSLVTGPGRIEAVLLSDESRFVTGQAILVDGGVTI